MMAPTAQNMQAGTRSKADSDADFVRAVRRVTLVGLGVNVVLSIVKLALGLIGHSQAVVADALHTFADVTTDLAVLLGVRYWAAPPDAEHPYGHGRIEAVIAAGIGGVVAFTAAGIGWRAVATLRSPDVASPGGTALAGAVLSIVCKELLYRWTVARGRRIGSIAVTVNAWHHRLDALSSLPAAAAVGLSLVRPSWSFLDHVGAIVVSLICLHAAWSILRPTLGQLTDTAAGRAEVVRIEGIARSVVGVRDVHAVRTRRVGSATHMDIHVLVDPKISVRSGHDIAEAVKRRLLASGLGVADCVVHIEPFEKHGAAFTETWWR